MAILKETMKSPHPLLHSRGLTHNNRGRERDTEGGDDRERKRERDTQRKIEKDIG